MVKIIFMIDDEDDRNILPEPVLKCNPHIDLLFSSNGVETLDLRRSHEMTPDVIFLGNHMPGMNVE